jgi:hypothetical protein
LPSRKLPAETWLFIASHLKLSDLASLCRTCSLLLGVSRAKLYRLDFTYPSEVPLIGTNSAVAECIRTLQITYMDVKVKWDSEYVQLMIDAVCKATSLRNHCLGVSFQHCRVTRVLCSVHESALSSFRKPPNLLLPSSSFREFEYPSIEVCGLSGWVKT